MPHDASSILTAPHRAPIEQTRATGYLALLICGSALPLLYAGLAIQLLPHAVPALLGDWGLRPSDLSTALAVGPAGLLIGGAIGRVAGDRMRPVRVLTWGGLVAAAATGGTALTRTPVDAGVVRVVMGVALGATMYSAGRTLFTCGVATRPASIAMVSIGGPAVGGILAAWLAAGLIPTHGWRTFAVAAGVTGLLPPVVSSLLPVAARLAAPREGARKDPPPAEGRSGHAEARPSRAAIASLVAVPHVRHTAGLFVMSFFSGTAVGLAILLLPVVFAGSGYPVGAGTAALWMFNAGAVGGAIVAMPLVVRLGSRTTLIGMVALAGAAALLLAGTQGGASLTRSVRAALMLYGAIVAGVQVTTLILARRVGPAAARTSSAAAAGSFAAIGSAVAAYAGLIAWQGAGMHGYFAASASCLVIAGLASVVLRRHIPPRRIPARAKRSGPRVPAAARRE